MTGVFVLVGLAVAAICVGIFFYVRRRLRIQRIERDTAISAELAAAGFGRSGPLDLEDDDDHTNMAMSQRAASRFALHHDDTSFDPYSDIPGETRGRSSGSARTARTPSLLPDLGFGGSGALYDPFEGGEPASPSPDNSSGTNAAAAASWPRRVSVSGTSYEPLLASYAAQEARSATPVTPPRPPPRNPLRAMHSRSQSPAMARAPPSAYHPPAYESVAAAEPDERLDPALLRNDSIGASTMRDERDYSRPMLAVRNMTDLSSKSSL